MAKPNSSVVQRRQGPLRDRYRRFPGEAWITDGAQTVDGCGVDPFHGAVLPAHSSGAPLRLGIHRAVGGDHDYPNPGDLLSAALAACLDSTMRMLADHLGIRLASLEVEVEAECDVRGCLPERTCCCSGRALVQSRRITSRSSPRSAPSHPDTPRSSSRAWPRSRPAATTAAPSRRCRRSACAPRGTRPCARSDRPSCCP